MSAALYALASDAIKPSSSSVYLLLNALLPLLVSVIALIPILRQPSEDHSFSETVKSDNIRFLFLNIIAILTGVYLLIFGSNSSITTPAYLLLLGALLLLVLPICVPGVVYARNWFHHTVQESFRLQSSGFILVHDDDLELHRQLLSREGSYAEDGLRSRDGSGLIENHIGGCGRCCGDVIRGGQLLTLGEEHSAASLVRRLDFWLYYIAYFCGGTIGLVYSNNLGQIAQSLGQSSKTTTLVTLYSSFSFFGRLLSAAPDYIRA